MTKIMVCTISISDWTGPGVIKDHSRSRISYLKSSNLHDKCICAIPTKRVYQLSNIYSLKYI